MNFLRNERGFTLTEILIGVAIAGIAALGGASFLANLEKSKVQMSRSTDFLMIEKLIESHLSSMRGCEVLDGVSVSGEEFSFKTDPNSPVLYGKGQKIGGIGIKGLQIKSFSPMSDFSEGAQSGMAEVELRLEKQGSRESWRSIPVAVIVKDGVVQGCNYELTRRFIEIRDELCSRAYVLSSNMNCEQVIIHLRNLAVESVCRDVYGAKPPRYITVGSGLNEIKHCDFSKIHAGKLCSGQYLTGFDATGDPQCAPERTFPPPATCTSWGNWAPDQVAICKDQPFTQFRNCEAGMTAYDSRPSTGTKDDASCCVVTSWTPKTSPSNVCTSDFVPEESNCGGMRTVMPGTKTDGSCCVVSSWAPASGVDPSQVCTSATYEEVNNCGGNRNESFGTKTDGSCSIGGCKIGHPMMWAVAGVTCSEYATMTLTYENVPNGYKGFANSTYCPYGGSCNGTMAWECKDGNMVPISKTCVIGEMK